MAAFVFLGYVAVPVVAYLVYWLVKRIRRGPSDGEGGEGDA